MYSRQSLLKLERIAVGSPNLAGVRIAFSQAWSGSLKRLSVKGIESLTAAVP
ncbi:hypothetical protein [Arthrobacter sp.]|uniref:hypothetical protein n=1 Tax=Arthrobacter sp. TaxID=1667 RepID=UPI0026E100A8|nr:hypothetical protein [Arthrobacter sp.]MDO5751620.1 hypothetical protein [Arthrobacter sp.]